MGRSEDNPSSVVVVIDDDEAARMSLAQMLRLRKFRVELFASAEAALAWPRLDDADCIISDVKMPGMNGERFLDEMTRREEPPPIIMITGHGDISMAVRCLKAGAYDFVEKPFSDELLMAGVQRASEKARLVREARDLRRRLTLATPEEDERFGMVGRSRALQDVFEQIETVARSQAPVLISGETGVGKELVAKAVHQCSPRRAGPFIPVNAGALTETILESELFGHRRGAFTGADFEREGRLVAAARGTFFLDEVESLSIKAQVQLLRVLEEGVVYPVGTDKPRAIDIRLIVATKAHLPDEVKAGRMREDFFHRVAVLPVPVPPLRERPEDIPLLFSCFLRRAAERNGVPAPTVESETLSQMLHYAWPGNVRELKNAVERMLLTGRGGTLGPFSPEEDFAPTRHLSVPTSAGRLRWEMEKTEKVVMEDALRVCNGDIPATCQYLGLSRRAFYERMKKYEIERDEFL